MFKRVLAVWVSILVLFLCFNEVEAEELEMKPYLYTQDFEDTDPIKFWISTKNAEYIVNHKGLTEEKSFSGKKSFKLDVTLGDKHYFYWTITLPKRIPAEGRLNFSGRVFLGEKTTASVALGSYFGTVPTGTSGGGNPHFGRFRSTDGKWRLVTADLVKYGKKIVEASPKYAYGVKTENIGVYVYRIGLYILGKRGDRIVVYIDDIKIEGEVPTEKAYKEEIKRRWAPAKERIERKLASWEKSLSEIRTSLELLEEAERKELEEKVNYLKAEIDKIKKKGVIYRKKYGIYLGDEEISSSIKELENETSKSLRV